MTHAFLLSGLPGAGKSTVAQYGIEITDGISVESGDVVRQLAAESGLSDPSSQELGDFAAEQREEQGPAFVAESIVGRFLRGDLPDSYSNVFIDGVRHQDEIREYKQYFDSTTFVWVDSSRDNRLERMQERARDGEDNFDALDLLERDSNEFENLGVRTLLNPTDGQSPDVVIENNESIDDLREDVREMIANA